MTYINDWFYWAVLSAVFAALTAIFAKIGLEGVDSDFATLVRTFVIIIVLASFVYLAGSGATHLRLALKHYCSLLYPVWPQVHHGSATFVR